MHLRDVVLAGADDQAALEWCWQNGRKPSEHRAGLVE